MIKLCRMKVKFPVQGHKRTQLFNTNINKRSFLKPGGAWSAGHCYLSCSVPWQISGVE